MECMKRILLVSAVLLGAVSASQAGVRLNLGFGLPLPPLPGIVISAPAPVLVAPPVCVAPPVFVAPPPVVVAPPGAYFGFGFRDGYRHWDGRYPYRGWVHSRSWHRR